MSTFLTAIIEVDEYTSDKFDFFTEDSEIINSIGDSFYAYMSNPSDYSKLLFSSGPYNENCVLIYYREEQKDIDTIAAEDLDAFSEILAELKRTGNLYLIDDSIMNLIIQNANQIFPVNDLDTNCIDMSHYE